MKERKHIALLIAVGLLLVLGAVVGCTLQWFYSPGVHRLFGYLHVELEQTGYIIYEGKVVENGVLKLEGTCREGQSDPASVKLQYGQIHDCDQDPEDLRHFLSYDTQRTDGLGVVSVMGSQVIHHTDPTGVGTSDVISYPCWIYLDDSGNVVFANYGHAQTGGSEPAYIFVPAADEASALEYMDGFISAHFL